MRSFSLLPSLLAGGGGGQAASFRFRHQVLPRSPTSHCSCWSPTLRCTAMLWSRHTAPLFHRILPKTSLTSNSMEVEGGEDDVNFVSFESIQANLQCLQFSIQVYNTMPVTEGCFGVFDNVWVCLFVSEVV